VGLLLLGITAVIVALATGYDPSDLAAAIGLGARS